MPSEKSIDTQQTLTAFIQHNGDIISEDLPGLIGFLSDLWNTINLRFDHRERELVKLVTLYNYPIETAGKFLGLAADESRRLWLRSVCDLARLVSAEGTVLPFLVPSSSNAPRQPAVSELIVQHYDVIFGNFSGLMSFLADVCNRINLRFGSGERQFVELVAAFNYPPEIAGSYLHLTPGQTNSVWLRTVSEVVKIVRAGFERTVSLSESLQSYYESWLNDKMEKKRGGEGFSPSAAFNDIGPPNSLLIPSKSDVAAMMDRLRAAANSAADRTYIAPPEVLELEECLLIARKTRPDNTEEFAQLVTSILQNTAFCMAFPNGKESTTLTTDRNGVLFWQYTTKSGCGFKSAEGELSPYRRSYKERTPRP